MPKLTVVPGVGATKPPVRRVKPSVRRGVRARRGGGGWLETAKVVFLLERPRRRPSSPSLRQIALVVVSAGLVIVIVRVAAGRVRSHAAEAPTTAPGSSDDTEPGSDAEPRGDAEPRDDDAEPRDDAAELRDDTEPSDAAEPGNDTMPDNESTLTETVQDELHRQSAESH